MIKIGITGSIASGKSTASKILCRKRGPLFSADQVVKKLYNNSNFKRLLSKKFFRSETVTSLASHQKIFFLRR